MAILNSDEVMMLLNVRIWYEGNLIRSGKALFDDGTSRKGPEILIIKKEEKSIGFIQGYRLNFSISNIKNNWSNWCGDSFAGALLAHLSNSSGKFPTKNEFKDLIHANVTASFTIEEMGVNRINSIQMKNTIRYIEYLELI